jgi:hypothetical protein
VVQDFAGPSKIYEFIMEDLICFSWVVGLLNSFRCPAICIREDPESIINDIPGPGTVGFRIVYKVVFQLEYGNVFHCSLAYSLPIGSMYGIYAYINIC